MNSCKIFISRNIPWSFQYISHLQLSTTQFLGFSWGKEYTSCAGEWGHEPYLSLLVVITGKSCERLHLWLQAFTNQFRGYCLATYLPLYFFLLKCEVLSGLKAVGSFCSRFSLKGSTNVMFTTLISTYNAR